MHEGRGYRYTFQRARVASSPEVPKVTWWKIATFLGYHLHWLTSLETLRHFRKIARQCKWPYGGASTCTFVLSLFTVLIIVQLWHCFHEWPLSGQKFNFNFRGLLFTSYWLNLQHWTGFYIAVYGDFQGLFFFFFRGLFFAFWGGKIAQSPRGIFPLASLVMNSYFFAHNISKFLFF